MRARSTVLAAHHFGLPLQAFLAKVPDDAEEYSIMRLAEIAERIGCELKGDGGIDRLTPAV